MCPFVVLYSGGSVNYGERGGSCPGCLWQHVCAQQFKTWAPSSKTGPFRRNTVLPGTWYLKQQPTLILFVSSFFYDFFLFHLFPSGSTLRPSFCLHSAPSTLIFFPIFCHVSFLNFTFLSFWIPNLSWVLARGFLLHPLWHAPLRSSPLGLLLCLA